MNIIDKYITEEVNIKDKLIEFFKNNPSPSDDEIHDFAEKEGINPHNFEEHIYKLLGSLVKKL